MTKYKAYPNINPYFTNCSQCETDKEWRFIQIDIFFLLHPRVLDLSSAALHLYFCMCLEAKGKYDFVFTESLALQYGFTHSTYHRAKAELIDAEFIRLARSGRCRREPNHYSFTLRWQGIA